MAFSTISGVAIRGIVSVLPENVEDNMLLYGLTDKERSSLIEHTGIRFRRRVKFKNTPIKQFFAQGIDRLLGNLQWEKSSVDLIIVVTQTAQTSIPSVSCELHGDLDFSSHTMAYDINLGCSGFVYGLHACGQTLSSLGKTKARAILCCGDLSSQITEEDDLTVRPIFSDGVSITAVELDCSDYEMAFNLETFGKGQKAIHTEVTGNGNWMRLNGIDVFNYSVKYVPKNIFKLYEYADKQIPETDFVVLHQANQIINRSILKSIGANPVSEVRTLYNYGNTASASIPITLANVSSESKKTVLLSGFGVGFSVATCLMEIEFPILTDSIFIDL